MFSLSIFILSLHLLYEQSQFGSIFTDFETGILGSEDEFSLGKHFSVTSSSFSRYHFVVVDGAGTGVLFGSVSTKLSEFLEASVASWNRAEECQRLILRAGGHSGLCCARGEAHTMLESLGSDLGWHLHFQLRTAAGCFLILNLK